MSVEGTSSRSRAPLWMRVTLALSLGVNLLIAGVVLGAALGRDRDGGPADRLRAARDLAPPPFVMALEPHDRRELIGAFREAAPKRQSRRELRARLQEVLTELRADSFDPAAMTALLSDQRSRAGARQTAGAEAFVAHLTTMSAEERRAYADRLEAVLRRGSKRAP